ncbi:MAG: acetylglutamate kinase [Spirochaetaceae bacterium]|nr:MAG: acetylglutamate kinase [Spirochaetaceae bacterium]
MAIIVKAGGTIAAEREIMESLVREIWACRTRENEQVLLIHGGGKAVTELAGKLGIVSTFRDGVRLTGSDEMALVDMVLAGLNNTELVRLAQRLGIPALGLTGADGALLTGRILYPEEGGRTAEVAEVNPAVIRVAQAAGFLPILATVGIGRDGGAVNINADEAAQAIAQALARGTSPGAATSADPGPVRLCYVSDTAGVLDAAGSVIREISLEEVESLIARGVVQGGMAAKLRSCAAAVQAGVERIVIGGYRNPGDLEDLLRGALGTSVVRITGEHGARQGARE